MKRCRCFALALLAALHGAALGADPVTGDIQFERKTPGTADVPPAIFPHWLHRIQFKCYVCHNATVGFKMKAGQTPVTMDAIEEGKFCGACHKGRPAFAVSFNTCPRCHKQ